MADINRDQNGNYSQQNNRPTYPTGQNQNSNNSPNSGNRPAPYTSGNNPYSTNRPSYPTGQNGQTGNNQGYGNRPTYPTGQNPQQGYNQGYGNRQSYPTGQGQYPNQQQNQQQQQQQNNADDIKKLNEKLSEDKEDKAGAFFGFLKRFIIVLIVLILIGAIGVAVYFFTKNTGNVSSAGQIELSVQVSENVQNVSPDQPTLKTAEIYPGDKFSVSCIIRNAPDIKGTDAALATSESIFIRYSISLEVDGVVYHNLVLPVVSDLVKDSWHVYNPEEEDAAYVWDGYYYYYGAVIPNEALTLFNEIEFCFDNIGNSFGGKKAKMTVSVQAVNADETIIGVEKGDAWNTAPRRWITNMQKHQDNSGNIINY